MARLDSSYGIAGEYLRKFTLKNGWHFGQPVVYYAYSKQQGQTMLNTYKQLTYRSGVQYIKVRSNTLDIAQMLAQAVADGYTVNSYRVQKHNSCIINKAGTTNILHILS
jgi:hypothetical protein